MLDSCRQDQQLEVENGSCIDSGANVYVLCGAAVSPSACSNAPVITK